MAFYHQTVEFLSESWANQRTQLPLLAVTGASFTAGLLLRSLFNRPEHKEIVLRSPRTKVFGIPEEENRQLPLPDDALPGARDVASPYGSIRVYEWGREDGPKVLLVHGITTPCIALGGVAHALVDRGCRVMLFDLYVPLSLRSPTDRNCHTDNVNAGSGEDTLTAPQISLRTSDCSRLKSCLL